MEMCWLRTSCHILSKPVPRLQTATEQRRLPHFAAGRSARPAASEPCTLLLVYPSSETLLESFLRYNKKIRQQLRQASEITRKEVCTVSFSLRSTRAVDRHVSQQISANRCTLSAKLFGCQSTDIYKCKSPFTTFNDAGSICCLKAHRVETFRKKLTRIRKKDFARSCRSAAGGIHPHLLELAAARQNRCPKFTSQGYV